MARSSAFFSTKTELLTQCLLYIDAQIDVILKPVHLNPLHLKASVQTMWYTYFNYLVSHASYAKFYRQFRHSSYYTPEVTNQQNKTYAFFYHIVEGTMPFLGINWEAFWMFVIETTLTFAIRVADGSLPGGEKDVEGYYRLISHGFTGLINKKLT